MFAVATNHRARSGNFIPMKKSSEQHPMLAQAVKGLRLRNGVQVKTFIHELERSKQEVSRWENGERPWPAEVLDRYLVLIGSSHDELQSEITRLTAQHETPSPANDEGWIQHFPKNLRILVNPNEEMSPWSEPGEKIFYEPNRQPKRFEGCVIELATGEVLIRLYERASEGRVYVKSFNPDKTENYLWSDIKGLHRIFVRGD